MNFMKIISKSIIRDPDRIDVIVNHSLRKKMNYVFCVKGMGHAHDVWRISKFS